MNGRGRLREGDMGGGLMKRREVGGDGMRAAMDGATAMGDDL